MTLLLFLSFLGLLSSCWGGILPAQVPQVSPLFSPHACNQSLVLTMVDITLQDINKDQKEGYILRLNRVVDAQENRQGGPDSIFYLTFDVLETSCHVLSKKNWKNCETRNLHELVYGRCKALFYVNPTRRILYPSAYNCTIRPISKRNVHMMCPDCPFPVQANYSDPSVFQAVSESLAKYNKEVAVGKKLCFFQVTRASTQWVVGPAYFVEYLVTEGPCTEGQQHLKPVVDAEPVGLCKGSLTDSRALLEKFISVSCEFFETQPTVAPESQPTESQNGQQPACPTTASLQETKGTVQFLNDVDDRKDKDHQEKQSLPPIPVQMDSTSGKPIYLPPHIRTFVLSKDLPMVFPFPEGSRSPECPGPAENANPLILPP
ncbi:fetuin-B [Monodelphis domestica]|uniref:Fetuin B n=1 Tax=Monodelphis domestica TaxID=13616 RepID=A0A5F8GRT3_MONDO|nr:fetuin-B [Monodelphis domestica]